MASNLINEEDWLSGMEQSFIDKERFRKTKTIEKMNEAKQYSQKLKKIQDEFDLHKKTRDERKLQYQQNSREAYWITH